MPPKSHLRNLKQALEAFVENLEELEGALLKFEEALLEFEEEALQGGASEHQNGHNLRLHSLSEVCQELGEQRTVVYRKLRSGEIPCLKLEATLNVRREDLKEYTKSRQHHRHHLELVEEQS